MVDQDENESGNPGHTHPGASALLWGGVFIDREIAVDRFASMVNQLVRGSILLYEKSPSRSTTTAPILVIFPSLPCRFDFDTRVLSCPFKEYGGGMCPLGRLDQSQISPTNGRFDPLQISSKVPLSIMIGVDGRARTGIIA
ncbi:hypothetical protein QYF36_008821 [Acer negundo]|nr:hypothetical protein QYF36_008821 [Acer negundo]